VLLAYNGAVHETTGETPALLFLGRNVQHPYDCHLRVGVSDAPLTTAATCWSSWMRHISA
ncbi:MAG: hypothetical protein ACK4QW_19600, partial [Alphaproteobacteria bacterium]